MTRDTEIILDLCEAGNDLVAGPPPIRARSAVGAWAVHPLDLGAANASIGSIASGSSDLQNIFGATAGAFNDNTVNFLGTGEEGYYRLFASSFDGATRTGLTIGDATTGGNFVTGLMASNLALV